jgi:hypothetical protein
LPSSPTSLCHIDIHPCPSSHPYSSLPLWYIATFPMAHPSKTYWERHWWQVSLHGVISHICLCWEMSYLQMDLHKISTNMDLFNLKAARIGYPEKWLSSHIWQLSTESRGQTWFSKLWTIPWHHTQGTQDHCFVEGLVYVWWVPYPPSCEPCSVNPFHGNYLSVLLHISHSLYHFVICA